MKLILRPAIPPCSLIIRKKASEHLAMVPNAETGPLSEVVHPILSSIAVTPGVSSARERRLPATAITPAAAEPARSERRLIEVILSSQVTLNPGCELRAVVESKLGEIRSCRLVSTR